MQPPSRKTGAERVKKQRAMNTRYVEREHDRQRSEPYKRTRNETKHKRRPFAAVDGEGGGRGDTHELYVLRAGDRELYTGRPLSTETCLTFLESLSRDYRYISYFFGYDVGMIVKDVPQETLQELRDRESRKIWPEKGVYRPVVIGDFEIDFVPRKEFRVRRRGYYRHGQRRSRWIQPSQWLIIDDIAGYFQSSFLSALQKWDIGTEDERRFIARMKDVRAEFGEESYSENASREIRDYNALECKLTVELTDKLRDICSSLGYHQSRYQGAGNLAGSMLRKHGDKSHVGLELPSEVAFGAACAYFGGRFEISRVGLIGQTVYEYDIQSAYPAAMLSLPCFCDGEWRRITRGYPLDPTVTALYNVQWEPQKGVNPYGYAPFQFRTHVGATLAPMYGVGWQWQHELLAHYALGKGQYRFKVLDCWVWEQRCTHRPFEWIPPLFQARIELGKSDKGRVLKLGMNSLYGKTAQVVGAGPFSNRVWAGLITSWTRARLLEVYYQLPPTSTVMMATDGIYTLEPVSVDLSPATLGAWECVEFDSLFLVQPGFYFDPDGIAKVKTRGIPLKKVTDALEDFLSAWERDGINGKVTIQNDFFIGVAVAALRGVDWPIGTWRQVTKDIAYRPRKRMVYPGQTRPDDGKSWMPLIVPLRTKDASSHPYRRDNFIRVSEWDAALLTDAPDFDHLINLTEYHEWAARLRHGM